MSDEVVYSSSRPVDAAGLKRLFAHTTWASRRSVEDVALLLRRTDAYVAAWSAGALVGFARALTDGMYRGLIDDVVVDPGFRGRGIGKRLLQELLLRLDGVEEIHLGCDERLVPFYESVGFVRTPGAHLRYRKPTAT